MTMRDDVRTAFERHQSALGDVADARHRLMRDALINRDQPANRGLQWAAAIAAVLIAAIVIATFALVKAGSHTSTVPAASPSPRAQTSPTPLGNVLNVPDSTPIIIYGDPSAHGQLDGITWDGTTSGKLANQMVAGSGNPQNNLFAGKDFVDDRSGATVMSGAIFGAKFFEAAWADDGRHVCVLRPFENPGSGNIPTTLELVTIGGATRDVAHVGMVTNQTSVQVAACSTMNDRAVVVQSGGQGIGTAQVWVLRLSTGQVLWMQTYDVSQVNVTVVASRDGQYVAENLLQGSPAGSTVYGPDGQAIAHLSQWVVAYSWDASVALAQGPAPSNIDLIDWRDGQALWTCPPGYTDVITPPLVQPEGDAIAMWLFPGPTPYTIPDLYVVRESGVVAFRITGANFVT